MYIAINDPDKISDLFHRHLMQTNSTSHSFTFGKYLFISLISGASIWLYINPSIKYASDSLTYKILLVAGSTWSNFGLSFWASDSSYDNLSLAFGPSNNYSRCFKIASSIGLAVAGTIPSLIPAAVALQEGSGGKSMKIAEAVTVTIGNLPTNAFSVLKLKNDVTNFFFASSSILTLCQKRSTSPQRIYELEILAIANRTHEHTLSALKYAKDNATGADIIKFQGESGLVELFKFFSKSTPRSAATTCKKVSRTLAFWLGFSVGTIDFPAYVLSTSATCQKITTNPIGSWLLTGLICLLPIYLSAKLGGETFLTIFDFFSSGCSLNSNSESSFLMKYKMITGLILTFSIVMAIFSYATAAQLAKDNFSDPDLSFAMQLLARIGITIFNGYGSIGFSLFLIMKIIEFRANPELLATLQFRRNMDALIYEVEQMDSIVFLSHFSKLPTSVRDELNLGGINLPTDDKVVYSLAAKRGITLWKPPTGTRPDLTPITSRPDAQENPTIDASP